MKKVIVVLLFVVVVVIAGCAGDDNYYNLEPENGTIVIRLAFQSDIDWQDLDPGLRFVDVTRECGNCVPVPVEIRWDEDFYGVVGQIERPAGGHLVSWYFETSDYEYYAMGETFVEVRPGEETAVEQTVGFNLWDDEAWAYTAQARERAESYGSSP